MTKDQKKISEAKHAKVHRMLVKSFPDCEVKYDGVEGIDHKIIYNGKTTYLETKTVRKIIFHGTKFPIDESPYLVRAVRLGRIQFKREEYYPYKKSQHEDLVNSNGWYIFVIGSNFIVGTPALDVDKILQKTKADQIIWDKILNICHPDWLDNLKKQVYDED